MSILKGILHHWNKTSSAYDTIHPETEVAQVADWNAGIVNTLASTGLSNLVNVLSSDSLLALLIKKVLDATGVKYSTGENGYLCLGSLFGGVIIQWVYDTQNTDTLKGKYSINIPISMNLLGCATSSTGDDSTNIIGWSTTSITVKTFQSHMTDTNHQVRRPFHAILIGKN